MTYKSEREELIDALFELPLGRLVAWASAALIGPSQSRGFFPLERLVALASVKFPANLGLLGPAGCHREQTDNCESEDELT